MLRLEPEAFRVGYCCWQPPEIGRTLTTRNSGVVDAEALAPALAGAIVPVTWTRCPTKGCMSAPDRR